MFEGSEHYRTMRNNRGLDREKTMCYSAYHAEPKSPKSKGLWRCYNDRSLSRT
jgi:hypothetical protein